MASSLPNDIFHNVFQRFAYNIDLIEKRFANKRPSGLELDVDTGKIIQVVDPKRPRLTVDEAKEKMKKTFLAPSSLMGNSTLSSPFVHDMTASRETKKRVLKHNKRFQQQVSNGIDCSTFLEDDENEDNNNAVYDEDEGNPEAEELFDLTDFLDEEEDNGEDKLEDDENEKEEELDNTELLESEDDSDPEGEEEQDKDLEEELDNEKENEEDLPFEEEEDEAADEENTYKNIKITRSLIERLTPKAIRGKKATATAASKKKSIPLIDSTPKAGRRRKSLPSASKKNTPLVDATPKAKRGRKSVASASKKKDVESTPEAKRGRKSMPSASKKKDAESSPKVAVSRKVAKAASEKVTSKKTPLVEDKTPKTSKGKKITKAASEKAPTKIKSPLIPKLSSRGRQLIAPKRFKF